LSVDFGISLTFNIANLKIYLGEEDELESRTTQMQEGKDDVDINTSDKSTPTHNQISGPITRARARQLNNQVSSFLASYSSYLDNGNVCSLLLLRNDGQEGNGVAFAPVTFRFQNSNSL
jgi:ribosomal protein S17E